MTYGWDIQQVDVNNAFLNGDLHEDVFMVQPEGFVDGRFPTHVCKLRKSLYGLKQAPRAWYTMLRSALHSWGFVRAISNASLFIKMTDQSVIYVLVYVNDILITGSDQLALHTFIRDLDTHFALNTLGSVHYFLGFEVFCNSASIFLS